MRLILLVLFFIACGVVCHFVAKGRGANPVLWGVIGLVFGPLAIPFVFFLDNKNE